MFSSLLDRLCFFFFFLWMQENSKEGFLEQGERLSWGFGKQPRNLRERAFSRTSIWNR